MREVFAVSRARDVALRDAMAANTLAAIDSLHPDGTSSLQRDIGKGRRPELEALSGAMARIGHEAGVATPVHEFVYHALLPLELRARAEVRFSPDFQPGSR